MQRLLNADAAADTPRWATNRAPMIRSARPTIAEAPLSDRSLRDWGVADSSLIPPVSSPAQPHFRRCAADSSLPVPDSSQSATSQHLVIDGRASVPSVLNIGEIFSGRISAPQ